MTAAGVTLTVAWRVRAVVLLHDQSASCQHEL